MPIRSLALPTHLFARTTEARRTHARPISSPSHHAAIDRRLRLAALRLLLQNMPVGLVQPVVGFAASAVLRRHGAVTARFAPWAGAILMIAPVDLSHAFALELTPQAPRLRIATAEDSARATAVLRGPLCDLLDLLEGHADGDALFFARGLSIDGDVEAVVALRNALDDEAIDLLDDVLAALGPLASVARRLVVEVERAASLLAGSAAMLPPLFSSPIPNRGESPPRPAARRAT